MRVRLTAKLADIVNGIDLSQYAEGDIIELSDHHGRLLMAEKWAEIVDEQEQITAAPAWLEQRAIAADKGAPGKRSTSFRDAPANRDDVA